MDVPKDIQQLVGKTSWQHSLKTTDRSQADIKRAQYAAHYKAEVVRFREADAAGQGDRAEIVVDNAFRALAAAFGSMDRAIACELDSVALSVRSSWSREDARAAERLILGEEISNDWDEDRAVSDVLIDPIERRRFLLRSELLESNVQTGGIAHQELARALAASGDYGAVSFQVACIAYPVREIDLNDDRQFTAIAAAYLARLANHEFAIAPELQATLSPLVGVGSSRSEVSRHRSIPDAAIPAPPDQPARTLWDAFDLWKASKRMVQNNKTADEFATAIRRFEQITGINNISDIKPDIAKAFKRGVEQLPYRPKGAVAALPASQQIAIAHEKGLATLSPPTVKKHLTAISAVLTSAVEEGWILSNPAAKITVDGARWDGTEREHFNDDDMKLIYHSPLLTDPDACSDTMFWILFLSPFHGVRPGELCNLKPDDVVRDGNEWLMRIKADRRSRHQDLKAVGVRPLRTKTKSSIREVPIHWIIDEAGFTDFARLMRTAGATWLFNDLSADKYGDRYKYLSRTINAKLRELGITDPDKSFYSTRHSMKREGRRQRIASQNLNQLSGHAEANVGERYGQGVPADTLKEDLDRLEYRSVDWDPVLVCAQRRVERFRTSCLRTMPRHTD